VEATDLSQKMRATFEAAIPGEDAVVRRVTAQRALRAAPQRSSFPRTAAPTPAPWTWQPGLAWAAAGLAVALGLFLLWPALQPERVPIGPSLTRDLASQGKAKKLDDEGAGRAPTNEPTASAPPSAVSDGRKDSAPKGERAAAVPTPESADARWAHVTAAMRKQDWKAAELALAPLIESADPETRDGARLVRVRLQLRTAPEAARDPKWREELSDLARSGSTSSIRASARRLLEEGASEGDSSADDSTNQQDPVREPSLGGN